MAEHFFDIEILALLDVPLTEVGVSKHMTEEDPEEIPVPGTFSIVEAVDYNGTVYRAARMECNCRGEFQ